LTDLSVTIQNRREPEVGSKFNIYEDIDPEAGTDKSRLANIEDTIYCSFGSVKVMWYIGA
jgi:hypothetical protein